MTLFLAIAAGMVLSTVLVMARGLRRAAPRLAVAVALLVPALVAPLYLLVGTPSGLDPQAVGAPESLDDAITRLEEDLQRDPRQPEGWLLLGRAHAGMGRVEAARDAIEHAARLLPDDHGLQVEYARARAQAHPQRRFDAIAVQALRDVLARDPGHQHARWFLGIAQRQAGDNAAAAATWEPLLAQLDAGTATTLRSQIDIARTAAGLPPLPATGAATAPAPPPAAAHALKLHVRVGGDPATRAQLPPDTSVFVLARQPGGSAMPVAARRVRLAELPLDIVLDDDDSPMPTQPLSALDEVEVEVLARISADGSANRSAGDIESPAVRVTLPTSAVVELVIDPAPP